MTREEAIRWLEDIHRRFNPTGENLENEGGDVHLQALDMAIESLSADRHTRLTNAEWKDFLSEQFGISKTSAKEMLHAMMSVKLEDNFKKQFSGRKG